MARWVSQSVSPSTSKRARVKVSYLKDLEAQVDGIIRDYFQTRPNGEDVTVDVLSRLGLDALTAAGGEREPGVVKQDVGLLVAMRLVSIFSPDEVLTYREEDGKKVSLRTARRADAPWINRYTPHRLLRTGTSDRIVLDTNVVRSVIYGDDCALDLDNLARCKGEHPVSVADPAWAELVCALVEGRMPFDLWSTRVRLFDAVLDPHFPVFPSGMEGAMLAGIGANRGFNRAQAQAYYGAVWQFVATARSMADFSKGREFRNPDGQPFSIGPLDANTLRRALSERGRDWAAFIGRITRAAASADTAPDTDFFADATRHSLSTGMNIHDVDRLDLPIRVLAAYGEKTARRSKPYIPEGVNDAIDFDVLFTVPLPAVVCTSDGPMRTLARTCGAGEAWRVKNPAELLLWLAGTQRRT